MIQSDRERQAPLAIEQAEPSHLARYKFALSYINENDVIIDAPCGTGYGTALLSSKAKKAIGVDICSPAIEHASELFSNEKNSFSVCDIEQMKIIEDNSLDLIVSFEGIEHLNHPEDFLNECRRILKKEGKLLISTPRRPHGSPYHIREFYLDEFVEILSKNFEINKMFGQIYTDIFDLSMRQEDFGKYNRFNFIAECIVKK